MSNSSAPTSGGIGFGGMLAILFIGLKLTGYITWPWLWVLAPLWIPLAVLGVILAAAAVFICIAALLGKK